MTADHAGTRDQAWIQSIIPEIIRLGAKYHCTVMDIANMWPDADTGIGRWLDSYAVHPNDRNNCWIYSAVADVLWPLAFSAESGVTQGLIGVPAWATGSGGTTLPIANRNGDHVLVGGIITFTSRALAFGITLCVLPVGFRPRAVETSFVTMTNSSGYYVTVPVQTSADGSVMLLQAVTVAVNGLMLGGLQFIGA